MRKLTILAMSAATAGMLASVVSAGTGDYLFDALSKPAFATLYTPLVRKAGLPAWVAHGGTATPAVTVKDKAGPASIYASCKPHDCASEQILIYYRPSDGRMSGVFVRNRHDDEASPASQTRLQWLGKPETEERRLLLGQLNVN